MTRTDIDNLEIVLKASRPDAPTSDKDNHTLKEQEALYNERYKSDTTWRCRLSWWVIIVDSVWLLAIICILILNGSFCKPLDNSVLITLLGTTTANVLGLALIVLNGLFGGPGEKMRSIARKSSESK